MRRPILGTSVTSGERLRVEAPRGPAVRSPRDRARLDLRLRRPRSADLFAALGRLDAGTHLDDRAALDALLAAIEEELGDLAMDERPLGIVARCFLGAPYEVHVCDLAGSIIEHFQTDRSMPPPFEAARRLAVHGAYQFVEVYPESLRAIASDGSVAVL